MNTFFTTAIAVLSVFTAASLYAHDDADKQAVIDQDRLIQFPDTKRYKTIVLDPHTHSSFSDGHVWPRIRVEEALRDGLDALAITEHLEWQPHLSDIPHPDRNRAYEIAAASNQGNDLIVVAGSEITRVAPEGHLNALFISDANKMMEQLTPKDPADTLANYLAANQWPAQNAVDAAHEQGAFVFWNHAWWGTEFPNYIPVATEFHLTNARNHRLHGMEIVNTHNYSEEAFQIALDLDLTLMGSSDVHELIDWDYATASGGHRPVTLVLATERSRESIREALFDGRTVVWFKNTLIGREQHMAQLLNASLAITGARYKGERDLLLLDIANHSDADFQLKNLSAYTFFNNTDIVEIPQHRTTQIAVKTNGRLTEVALQFEVLNALVKPKTYANIVLSTDDIAIEE